jgi:hypothetical protein
MYKLQVDGVIAPVNDGIYNLGSATNRFNTVYATNGALQTSDLRQKQNIQDSDLGLDFILDLRPVYYNWKSGDKNLHYGLIAQETEEVIQKHKTKENHNFNSQNTIVDYDKESDSYGVRYSELIAPVIKALQELYEQFLSSKREIASLKSENEKLKAYLCAKDPEAGFCE